MSPLGCTRAVPSLLSSFSSLSIQTAAPRATSRTGQIRTQATTRRTTKRLRVSPSSTAPRPYPGASTHTPASRFSRPTNPATTSITFSPPPSAPSPYYTPAIFLPPSDPRRQTLAPVHAAYNPYAVDKNRQLPPVDKETSDKKYHMTAEQIAEMRKLRLADPEKWNRRALAHKFGCTEFFVSIAAPTADKTRMEKFIASHQAQREQWGAKRRKAREDRDKRRKLWFSDA